MSPGAAFTAEVTVTGPSYAASATREIMERKALSIVDEYLNMRDLKVGFIIVHHKFVLHPSNWTLTEFG